VIECDSDKVDDVCRIFKEEVERPISIHNDPLIIPLEISVGKNWKDTNKV